MLLNNSTVLPQPRIMKADTGSSTAYMKPTHRQHLLDCKKLAFGPIATLLLYPTLQPSALVYTQLNNESLILIG